VNVRVSCQLMGKIVLNNVTHSQRDFLINNVLIALNIGLQKKKSARIVVPKGRLHMSQKNYASERLANVQKFSQ